jgi:hypothetical protein
MVNFCFFAQNILATPIFRETDPLLRLQPYIHKNCKENIKRKNVTELKNTRFAVVPVLVTLETPLVFWARRGAIS